MTEDYSCPFCKETDWKNEINLARHIEKEHYYKSITSYIRLRNKILSRIEHLEGHGIYIEYDDLDVIRMLNELLK